MHIATFQVIWCSSVQLSEWASPFVPIVPSPPPAEPVVYTAGWKAYGAASEQAVSVLVACKLLFMMSESIYWVYVILEVPKQCGTGVRCGFSSAQSSLWLCTSCSLVTAVSGTGRLRNRSFHLVAFVIFLIFISTNAKQFVECFLAVLFRLLC